MSQRGLSLSPASQISRDPVLPASSLETCHILAKKKKNEKKIPTFSAMHSDLALFFRFCCFLKLLITLTQCSCDGSWIIRQNWRVSRSRYSDRGGGMNVGKEPESMVLFWHLQCVLLPAKYFGIQQLLRPLGSYQNNLFGVRFRHAMVKNAQAGNSCNKNNNRWKLILLLTLSHLWKPRFQASRAFISNNVIGIFLSFSQCAAAFLNCFFYISMNGGIVIIFKILSCWSWFSSSGNGKNVLQAEISY